jgi:hypothetical protein
VARQLGCTSLPTFEHFLWAHCVFWSRGQSLPVPNQPGEASQLLASANGGNSSTSKRLKNMFTVHEGIVPGLDFANHRFSAPGCWWEVCRDGAGGSGDTSNSPAHDAGLNTAHVRLQLHRGWVAHPGDELTISYGEGRSNEELLLLYGFVAPPAQQGANDMVMLACPLPPPAEWDDLMEDRMRLLRVSAS